MLPGVVVPFVPFACDRSPSDQIAEAVLDLASVDSSPLSDLFDAFVWLPFFLAIPIVLWMIFRLLGRPSTRIGRITCSAIGGSIGLGLIAVLAKATPDLANLQECVVFGIVIILLALCAASVTVLIARRGLGDDCVGTILVGPYAVTLVLFLIAYQNEAQIGWYLSLAPAIAALGELLFISVSTLRPRGGRRPRAAEIPVLNAD
jgi:hypothetical protein